MRELIKRLLKEEFDNSIQEVEFDGFSEPVLIPQFNKYLVKFNGTGKVEKVSDSEKIVFKDKQTGKEYVFDSNDVQKSGNSPFYINLDVLRRNYNIEFEDEFVRHKQTLSPRDYHLKLVELIKLYSSEGRCKNEKCSEVRDTIEQSLKDLYGKNYGTYSSEGCEPTDGFLNIFPMKHTKDKNGNLWSKLNYVIFKTNAVSTLLMTYLKRFGTFEHKDFIQWIKDEKTKLFKGKFLELMIRNIQVPFTKKLYGDVNFDSIKKLFPKSEIIDKFCPSNRKNYSELINISNNGKTIVFQPVDTKTKKIFYVNGKYYILFGRRNDKITLNRKADYIIISGGAIFKNTHVTTGDRAWEFEEPPIYYTEPFATELNKSVKLK